MFGILHYHRLWGLVVGLVVEDPHLPKGSIGMEVQIWFFWVFGTLRWQMYKSIYWTGGPVMVVSCGSARLCGLKGRNGHKVKSACRSWSLA